jgi:hypothetical protein
MASKKAWGVTLDGQADLIRRLQAVLTIVRREVGILNREIALKGLDRARLLVPTDTGALLQSLDINGGGMVWRFGAFNYEGRYMVPHWVEYGTSKMDPQPYMRPASEWARTALPQGTKTIARELPFKVRNA